MIMNHDQNEVVFHWDFQLKCEYIEQLDTSRSKNKLAI